MFLLYRTRKGPGWRRINFGVFSFLIHFCILTSEGWRSMVKFTKSDMGQDRLCTISCLSVSGVSGFTSPKRNETTVEFQSCHKAKFRDFWWWEWWNALRRGLWITWWLLPALQSYPETSVPRRDGCRWMGIVKRMIWIENTLNLLLTPFENPKFSTQKRLNSQCIGQMHIICIPPSSFLQAF